MNLYAESFQKCTNWKYPWLIPNALQTNSYLLVYEQNKTD